MRIFLKVILLNFMCALTATSSTLHGFHSVSFKKAKIEGKKKKEKDDPNDHQQQPIVTE